MPRWSAPPTALTEQNAISSTLRTGDPSTAADERQRSTAATSGQDFHAAPVWSNELWACRSAWPAPCNVNRWCEEVRHDDPDRSRRRTASDAAASGARGCITHSATPDSVVGSTYGSTCFRTRECVELLADEGGRPHTRARSARTRRQRGYERRPRSRGPVQTGFPLRPEQAVHPVYVLRKTVREFGTDQCTDLAAALTYYAVLSVFPALVVMVSLLGVFGQGQRTTDAVLADHRPGSRPVVRRRHAARADPATRRVTVGGFRAGRRHC